MLESRPKYSLGLGKPHRKKISVHLGIARLGGGSKLELLNRKVGKSGKV